MENNRNRGRARGRARPPDSPPPPTLSGAWASGNPLRSPRTQGPAPVTPPRQPVVWGPSRQQSLTPRQNAPGSTDQTPSPQSGDASNQPKSDKQMQMRKAPEDGAVSFHPQGHGDRRGRGRKELPTVTITTKLPNLGKQGTHGKSVALQANYFRLVTRPDWCLFQYRVDFAPDLDVTHIKKRLFYNAVAKMEIRKGLFDGTVLYTPFRLHPDPREILVASLTNPDEKIRITIRMVGELDKSSYHYLQVYNLIVRKCMSHLNLQLIGRDYFDRDNREVILNYNLELWPGFVNSIRQHEREILMCVEIRHKVMKTETALSVIRKIKNDRHSGDSWESAFRNRMLNVVVLTDYNNKTYHIDDVDFERTPESTFQMKDGSTVSFRQYYDTRYNLKLTDLTQPLLVTKVKPRRPRGETAIADSPQSLTMLLIPELCRMTGLTEQERANRQMMTALGGYMIRTPAKRIGDLLKFNERLHSKPESIVEMKQFDLTLSKDIISFSGRELGIQELLCNGGRTKYSADDRASWTNKVCSNTLYRIAKMDQWAIVYSKNDANFGDSMKGFFPLMQKAAKGMGLNLGNPIFQVIHDSPGKGVYNVAAIIQAIEGLFAKYPKLMFFMVIVPPNRNDQYMRVKKKLTSDHGVCSQVMTSTKTDPRSNKALSIATKVVIQINSKCGGAPWTIQLPEFLSDLMVVGYDVCHDPKNKSRSFGAFVASYDPKLTAYYSAVNAHKDGEELSNFISMSLESALAKYTNQNKKLPRILFFRDGVGDGQIQYVYEHEIKRIQEKLIPLYGKQNLQLRLRVIVVNKRGNARIFKNGNNPAPGTVVDDFITMPERSDFYLISQCTNRGTVSPTYYNILGPDEFGVDTNGTQILTHRLCHNYYNWSGSVRVPAPCQYAHKLAFLATNALQRCPHKNLEHLLHFL